MFFCFLFLVGEFGEKSIGDEIVNVSLNAFPVIGLQFSQHSGNGGTKKGGRVFVMVVVLV